MSDCQNSVMQRSGPLHASGSAALSMPRAATLGQQWGGLALVLLVATLAALAVLRVSRNEPTADLQWVDLRAGWRVSDGDDLRRSLPGFDDSAWSTIDFPVGWSGPEVESDWWWFRREVRVTPNWDGRSLDFEIGGVHSAYELFVNGQRIGGAGRLGPDGVADFDRIRRFVTECDCHDGRLLLALRVWRDANVAPTIGGLTQGPFQMALAADVMRSTQPLGTTDLLYFGLATLFAGTGLLYLELYRRWPAQCGYLWIGLLAFGYGAYLLLRSESHRRALQNASGKVSADQFAAERRRVRAIWHKVLT